MRRRPQWERKRIYVVSEKEANLSLRGERKRNEKKGGESEKGCQDGGETGGGNGKRREGRKREYKPARERSINKKARRRRGEETLR